MDRTFLSTFPASRRSAFSLIDTIIAISVLALTIVGITGLTLTSMRANEFNENKLRAYYLAQEGVEAIRAMRDSNWLQNYQWNAQALYNQPYDISIGKPYILKAGVYVVERNLDFPENGIVPWQWQYFADHSSYEDAFESLIPATRCELSLENTLGCTFQPQSDTKYRRFIEISFQEIREGFEIMHVESVVVWNERGSEKSLSLQSAFTDWKKKPI